MKEFTIAVKPDSFRKLRDPFLNTEKTRYVFYVKVEDVPEGIPMATNPREQNLNTAIARAIRDSLESNDGLFHLKNRGIVLSAQSVHFDNRKEEVRLLFSDDLFHGNVDGGHTYRIVCEAREQKLDQYVPFEVMTGVEDVIEGLAEARNMSVQVDEKSLAELAKKFEPIKEAIEGMPFFKRIAFKQNQTETDDDTGKNFRMIDAREIVAILGMFNVNRYSTGTHPVQAYSSKKAMLDHYLADVESYRKFINIAPDVFDLYEAVETDFAEIYNAGGGRFGRKKYAGYKDGKFVSKSKFGLKDMMYRVPDGLIYPIVGAFRALVEHNTSSDRYQWVNGLDPCNVWQEIGAETVEKIMKFATSIGDNPMAVGKDTNVWDLMYMTIERSKLHSGV